MAPKKYSLVSRGNICNVSMVIDRAELAESGIMTKIHHSKDLYTVNLTIA